MTRRDADTRLSRPGPLPLPPSAGPRPNVMCRSVDSWQRILLVFLFPGSFVSLPLYSYTFPFFSFLCRPLRRRCPFFPLGSLPALSCFVPAVLVGDFAFRGCCCTSALTRRSSAAAAALVAVAWGVRGRARATHAPPPASCVPFPPRRRRRLGAGPPRTARVPSPLTLVQAHRSYYTRRPAVCTYLPAPQSPRGTVAGAVPASRPDHNPIKQTSWNGNGPV